MVIHVASHVQITRLRCQIGIVLLQMLLHSCLTIKMIILSKLSEAPFPRIAQCAEHESLQFIALRRCGNDVSTLGDFSVHCCYIRGDAFGFSLGQHARVLHELPKIGHGEDAICAFKCPRETVDVIKISRNQLHAGIAKPLSRCFGRITRDTADLPARLSQKGANDRTSLLTISIGLLLQ